MRRRRDLRRSRQRPHVAKTSSCVGATTGSTRAAAHSATNAAPARIPRPRLRHEGPVSSRSARATRRAPRPEPRSTRPVSSRSAGATASRAAAGAPSRRDARATDREPARGRRRLPLVSPSQLECGAGDGAVGREEVTTRTDGGCGSAQRRRAMRRLRAGRRVGVARATKAGPRTPERRRHVGQRLVPGLESGRLPG